MLSMVPRYSQSHDGNLNCPLFDSTSSKYTNYSSESCQLYQTKTLLSGEFWKLSWDRAPRRVLSQCLWIQQSSSLVGAKSPLEILQTVHFWRIILVYSFSGNVFRLTGYLQQWQNLIDLRSRHSFLFQLPVANVFPFWFVCEHADTLGHNKQVHNSVTRDEPQFCILLDHFLLCQSIPLVYWLLQEFCISSRYGLLLEHWKYDQEYHHFLPVFWISQNYWATSFFNFMECGGGRKCQ